MKNLRNISDTFQNLTTAIGNGKVIKSPMAHAALRGGAYIGSAYVLYRGLKALFNRSTRPRVQVIEVPEETATRIFKTARPVEDAEVIDV